VHPAGLGTSACIAASGIDVTVTKISQQMSQQKCYSYYCTDCGQVPHTAGELLQMQRKLMTNAEGDLGIAVQPSDRENKRRSSG
jgi:hypothetical protein